MEMKVKWRPFLPEQLGAYLAFAREQFGEHAYQAKPAYLEWLYEENPEAKAGYEGFLVGTNDQQEVVGCIHKLYQRWHWNGKSVVFPAIHNLAVHPDYRGGLGSLLILSSLRGEEMAFVPGVASDQTPVYERLKFHKLAAHWYRSPVHLARGAFRIARHKVRPGPNREIDLEKTAAQLNRKERKGIQHEIFPNDETLKELLASVERRRPAVYPEWNLKSFRWRFFHPKGPRHLLLRAGLEDFAILSVGNHRGSVVARLNFVCLGDKPAAEKLLSAARSAARASADFLLGYSADPKTNALFEQAGWRTFGSQASSFLYSRLGMPESSDWGVGAEAGDFGFEAIV